MISHLSLQKKTTLSHSVSLQTDKTGFEFIIVAHPKLDAAFALQGAHLLHFQLKEQAPTIWLSKTACFNEQTAIRGGVPICWPWFGAADQSLGDKLPAHGFARTSKWSIKSINELAEGVEIEFLLQDSEQTRKIWPYPFELTLKARLTDTLQLRLISKNTGKKAFCYTAALHTYFNISSPNACHIAGLGYQYADKLKASQVQTSDGSLQINGPIDSIYHSAPDLVVLCDNQLQRQLTISNSGNDSDVVWTPWVEGARAFKDMPDCGYQTMLCIESAITHSPGVIIKPGDSDCLSSEINSLILSNTRIGD